MSTKPKLKLKKMKDFPNILHVDSNLVLNSLEDKTVIGKYENLKIVLLNKSDIDLCNNWKLVYDPEKINEDENEDENEDDDEEEEHEEVKELNEHVEEVKEHVEVQEHIEEVKEYIEEDKNKNNEVKEHFQEDEKEYISLNNVATSKHILDVTTQFTKDIHNHFDTLTHFYTEKISDYENKISNMDIQYNNLLEKYNSLLEKYTIECNEHSNTKENFKKLHAKFEGIKSLFN
jgi:chromosome segregation ATPase